MPINGFDDESAPVVRRRRISLRFVAGAIVLGTAIGLILTIVVLVVISRGQPPHMTSSDFEAARQRWQRHGPASYDMDIEQSLGVSGKIHVEVRKGQVTAMTINGEPAAPRLWDNWSVPGLFDIIRMDVNRNDAVVNAPDQPIPVFQQAEFDPINGLPRIYRRSEPDGGQTVERRIVGFQPVK